MPDQITNIGDQDARRLELGERVKVYDNDWDEILTQELRQQFVQDTWKYIRLMLDTSQNIFRRIVREICTIYKRPAQRWLVQGDNEIESERWEELKEELDLDAVLAEAHRLAKAATICFIRVKVIESEARLALQIITPDYAQVDLGGDNALRMDGFGWKVLGSRRSPTEEWWVYYTRDKRYFLNKAGQPIADPRVSEVETEPGDQENRYGIIPVVPFHCVYPVRSFWTPNATKDAYRANIIAGVLNTYCNYLIKMQSFKQVAISGDNVSEKLLNAISDPAYPWVLPAGASAAVLDLTANLDMINRVIFDKVKAIANNYGISSDNFTISGDVQSGFALKIANRALEEIREADKLIAATVEHDLFDVIRKVNNVEFPEQTIPEDVELRWNPSEIAYPPTWEEEQARWTFEMDIGAADVVDYLMEHDPDLTEEEAIEQIKRVKERGAEINPAPSMREQLLFGEPAKKKPGAA